MDWETTPSATTTYNYKKGKAATLFKMWKSDLDTLRLGRRTGLQEERKKDDQGLGKTG